MGASLTYRKEALLDFKAEKGAKSYFKFGSCCVTGWRRSQEDRLVCFPNFAEDLSFFAIYDGHGGNEVADYLVNNLNDHLAHFLAENEPELALQLSFLACDHNLRNVGYEDISEVEDEDDIEQDLPDRKSVIPALKALFAHGSAGSSKEENSGDSESLRKTIASETLKFLTLAELEPEDSDDEDENYEESMDDSESNKSSDEECSTSNKHGSLILDEEASSDDSVSSEKADAISSETGNPSEIEDPKLSEKGNPSEIEDPESSEKEDPSMSKIGYQCGSTATVVLLNQKEAFIANIGDSRCIASLKGQAKELTVDHKPEDKEESERIINAGSKVTDDGRVDGGLNMSRAFGNFYLKKEDDAMQAITCDPYVNKIEISKDLDFIVIASDGIWNSMENQEIVDYINIRINEAELQDICEEIFKFILADNTYGDGTGCDNMSMIILQFNNKGEPFKEFHISYDDMELETDEQDRTETT